MKQFVHEAVQETLKLGSALARLRTPRRIALVHYSPIQATVEGEPREIYPVSRVEPARGADRPLLGDGRLPRPRAPRTARGTDARRRARSTTSRCRCCSERDPDRPPFRLLTVPACRRRSTVAMTAPTLQARNLRDRPRVRMRLAACRKAREARGMPAPRETAEQLRAGAPGLPRRARAHEQSAVCRSSSAGLTRSRVTPESIGSPRTSTSS